MTQYEILEHALTGIATKLDKEEEINKRTIEECRHENSIALHRIEKLTKQFYEVINMMGEMEQAVNELK